MSAKALRVLRVRGHYVTVICISVKKDIFVLVSFLETQSKNSINWSFKTQFAVKKKQKKHLPSTTPFKQKQKQTNKQTNKPPERIELSEEFRGAYDRFPDFFRMDTFSDSTHMKL